MEVEKNTSVMSDWIFRSQEKKIALYVLQFEFGSLAIRKGCTDKV